MALTPYKNPETPLNRNRSSSCSSPVRNRIVYQEIYSVGLNTLVRSYSCDQVWNKDETGRTFQTTQIQISSFLTPEKKTYEKSLGGTVKTQTRTPRALKFPGKMEKEVPKAKPKPKISIMSYVWILIVSVCLWLYINKRECIYIWDLEKTKTELTDNVFGQTEAISKIHSVLRETNEKHGFNVMIFTGGVGVGKTFSSSIISRNFPWSSNKLITYSENFNSHMQQLLMNKWSHCGCNLIIIDDLPSDITSEPITLIKSLSSKRESTDKILVILIYQIHNEYWRNFVIDKFKNELVDFHHIPFKPLNRDDVLKCFNFESKRHKVVIPTSELNKLVDEKMKLVEAAKGPVGCKGVIDDVLGYYNKNQQ